MGESVVAPVSPMIQGVEVEVGAEFEQGLVGVTVGGSAGQDCRSEELVGELGLPEPGSTAAIEVLAQNGKACGRAKALSAWTIRQPDSDLTRPRISQLRRTMLRSMT